MALDEAIQHCYDVANKGCDECAEEHLQLAKWLEELKELSIMRMRIKMDWIPVAERLPKRSGEVLVCLDYGKVDIVTYSAKHKQFNNFDDLSYDEKNIFSKYVVAWMPLPEPYI